MYVAKSLVVVNFSDDVEPIALLAAVEGPSRLGRTSRGMFKVDMTAIDVSEAVREAVYRFDALFEIVSLIQGTPMDNVR